MVTSSHQLPLIGPISCYLSWKDGKVDEASLSPEMRHIFRGGFAISKTDFSGGREFYEQVPTDHRAFLSAAKVAVRMAIGSGDEELFDRVLADVRSYSERYPAPETALGVEIYEVWLKLVLRVKTGYPAWIDDVDFTQFPSEWFHIVAFLVVHRLWYRRDLDAARHLANMLISIHAPGTPYGLIWDVSLKQLMGEIYHEQGKVDEALRWYREAAKSAAVFGNVRPMLGRLLGPKSPLEIALREEAPELLEKISKKTDDYFRNVIHFHNHLTGETITEKLSVREFYLGCSLRRGLRYKEIALRMGVSDKRLAEMASRLYAKLNLHGASELESLIW